MTTENDDVLDRQKRFGNRIYDEGVYPSGYQDPAGVYPRSHYYYQSSINEASKAVIDIDVSDTVDVLFSAVTVISSMPPRSLSSSSENRVDGSINRNPKR